MSRRRALCGRSGEDTQLLQRLAEQARDLHLGDADAGRDLRLGQFLHEPQAQDQALARRQLRDHRRHRGVELDQLVAALLAAEVVAV